MPLVRIPDASKAYFERHYPSILASGMLAEGIWNDRLAEAVCSLNGSPYCIPVASNGTGMMSVLQVLNRHYGAHGIFLQGNTMYGVKTAVHAAGMNIGGYVDCGLGTLMPQFEHVVEALEHAEPGNILLLSHIGGIPNPDIEKIAGLCAERQIYLVEDCAQSFLAKAGEGHSGNFGIAGVFSFYGTKAVPAGEGGAIVTSDERLYRLLDRYRKCDRFEQEMEVGLNIRPSELQALFILSVVRESDAIIQSKSAIARQYAAVCRQKGLSYISPDSLGVSSNHYKFVLLDDTPASPTRSIQNRTSAVFDYFIDSATESLPGVRQIVAGHVCLPTWAFLEQEIVDQTVRELSKL